MDMDLLELFTPAADELKQLRAALAELKKIVEGMSEEEQSSPAQTPDGRVFSDEILPVFYLLKQMRDAQKSNAPNRKKLERALDDKIQDWIRS